MLNLMKANAALLFAGVASFILMGAGQSLYGPMLPAFSRGFGVGLGTAGFVISAHWFGCALGVGLMFFRGTHATPRHVIMAMGLGASVMAVSTAFWMILLGGFVFGAGYGAATVVFNPRFLRAFGARGAAMLSLLNACFGIGAIGAPLLFVALGNAPAPSFVICAVMALVIWAFSGPASRPETASAAARTGAYRLHLPILTFQAVAIGIEAALIGLGPAALIAAGETEVWAAKLLSLFFLGFLAVRVALIFIAHLLPSFSFATMAMIGTAIASLGAATLASGPFFVIMGLCAGAFFPCIYVTASQKMGDDPRVPATVIAAGLIGGILGPLALSPMMASLGAHGFFWLFAAISGLMSVAAIVFRRILAA